MVNYLIKKKINQVLAITLTLLIFIAITIFVISFLSIQMMQFSDSLPKLVEKFNQFANSIESWASIRFQVSKQNIHSMVLKKRSEFINNGGVLIGETIVSTGSKVVVMLLIPVYVL